MNIEEMIQGNPQALVTNYNGVLVADSLEVADRFGKAHKNVIQAIENLKNGLSATAEISALENYFIEDAYPDNRNGRRRKKYLLTRDGFSLLVMGFTGPAALHWKLLYIEAFNKMEERIKTQPDLTAMVTQITTQVIQTLLPELKKAVAPPEPPQLPEKKPTSLEDLPNILTVYNIRDYLQIGQRQAYELAHNDDFPVMKIGNRLLIQKSDFVEWLQRRKGYV